MRLFIKQETKASQRNVPKIPCATQYLFSESEQRKEKEIKVKEKRLV